MKRVLNLINAKKKMTNLKFIYKNELQTKVELIIQLRNEKSIWVK